MPYDIALPAEFDTRFQNALTLTAPEKKYAALLDLYIDIRNEEKNLEECEALQASGPLGDQTGAIGEKVSWRGAKAFFDEAVDALNGELDQIEKNIVGGAEGETAQRACDAFLARAKKFFYEGGKQRLTPLFQQTSRKFTETIDFPAVQLDNNGQTRIVRGTWQCEGFLSPR